MANGNSVTGMEHEQGVEVILYENTQRGTQFKAYQLAKIEFVRGDDVPRRDRKTGQYLRNEDGTLVMGVSRSVSATTAMGGTLTHAVSNLQGGSFQRSVNFLKSALLPRTGKSMVSLVVDEEMLTMSCAVRLTLGMPDAEAEGWVVVSTLPATKENMAQMRLLAAEEIAAQIVAAVGNAMAEYVANLEPDSTVEDSVADMLNSIEF